MKQNYLKIGLLLSLGLLANTSKAQTLTGADVGSPSQPGSMKLDAATKVYTVVGGGSDIWNASDNFFYAYFKVTGDFDYVVNVNSLVGNSGDGGWSKAELMARQDDGSGAPQGGDPFIANMVNRPSSDTANGAPAGVNNRGPQWRAIRDDLCSWTTPNPTYPPNAANNWLRLERVGNVFYMYTGNDGKTWNMYNPYNPQGWDTSGSWPPGADNPAVAFFTNAWQKTILLGLAVTAHSDPDVSTATFSDFGPYTPTPVAITTQPVATVNISANSKLSLSVAATGDPVHYQWMKDGKAIAQAVGPAYTVAFAKTSDSGSYTARVFGGGKEVISSASVVAVSEDTTTPTLVSASGSVNFNQVTVKFSKPLDKTSAEKAANYAITPALTVSSATLVDLTTVLLTTSKQTSGTEYTVTVTNVKDDTAAGRVITVNNTAKFTAWFRAAGFLTAEFFTDITGTAIQNLLDAQSFIDNQPNDVRLLVAFDTPNGYGDNYGARVAGWLVPKETAQYDFFIRSDDASQLYLSANETAPVPGVDSPIAEETGCCNAFIEPGIDSRTTAAPIALVAGKKYAILGLLKEGTGGDYLQVAWRKAGDTTAAASLTPIPGSFFETYVDANGAKANITTQPASVTGVDGKTVSFSVVADTYSPISTAVAYQWQKNGADISGATRSTYITPVLAMSDNGAKFTVVVSVPGLSTTSAAAVLTMVADTFPPVPAANAVKNQAGTYDVGIAFDETVDSVELGKQANFTISAGTVTAFKAYKTGATLTVSGLTAGTKYTVTVTNVADLKGNRIATATADFTVGKMAWGVVGGDRLKLGNGVVTVGDNGFDIYSDGATEWNNYDESTFVYEQITGDFDKKLRVEYQDSSSQWARAGLIARDVTNFGVTDAEQAGSQTIDSNSGVAPFDGKACRYQKVHVNPVTTAMGTAGNNTWEGNRRLETGGPCTSAGGGGIPLYPNAWCRLQRVGDLFTIYRSDDGVNWTQLGTTTFTLPMTATVFVGPDYSPENGNITDATLQGMWLAKFRDYGDTFAATTGTPTLAATRGAAGLTITFTGKLQSATAVTGPWTDVSAAASPYAAPTTGAGMFFRAAK